MIMKVLKKWKVMQKLHYQDIKGLLLINISLVPYEMLATGLPIFEFKEGTFNYFFPKGSALVTSFDYNEFYEMFKNAINNPNLLKEINKVF